MEKVVLKVRRMLVPVFSVLVILSSSPGSSLFSFIRFVFSIVSPLTSNFELKLLERVSLFYIYKSSQREPLL